MSILNFITKYAKAKPSRWHTPGHKGTLNDLDITELVCDEKLELAIKNAQNMAADFYSANSVHFLTNGSSIGIKAAILANDGGIISFSGQHQAIKEGMNLLAKRTYVHYDVGIGSDGLPNVVTASDVKKAIKNFSTSCTAVYIESPDYYGRVVKPDVITEIKKYSKRFFCDAAHGAHFAASSTLKNKCYASVADVVNLSAHKTLDAYTQTAYLCVNDVRMQDRINQALKNLGTTSPNYLLMASLEQAIDNAKKYDYNRLEKDCLDFRKKVPCLDNDDFSRLVVDAKALGYSGKKLTQKLISQNIYPEKFTDNYVVFIATPHETQQDFGKLTQVILN